MTADGRLQRRAGYSYQFGGGRMQFAAIAVTFIYAGSAAVAVTPQSPVNRALSPATAATLGIGIASTTRFTSTSAVEARGWPSAMLHPGKGMNT